MSLSDAVPVETLNKDGTVKNHESSHNESPPLREREGNDDNSEESSESGLEIDWNLAELIPEFRQTYKDEDGRQSKQEQEVGINVHRNKEGVSLATFHEMFPLRNKYPYWH